MTHLSFLVSKEEKAGTRRDGDHARPHGTLTRSFSVTDSSIGPIFAS